MFTFEEEIFLFALLNIVLAAETQRALLALTQGVNTPANYHTALLFMTVSMQQHNRAWTWTETGFHIDI